MADGDIIDGLRFRYENSGVPGETSCFEFWVYFPELSRNHEGFWGFDERTVGQQRFVGMSRVGGRNCGSLVLAVR
jgi:hypothetical protein